MESPSIDGEHLTAVPEMPLPPSEPAANGVMPMGQSVVADAKEITPEVRALFQNFLIDSLSSEEDEDQSDGGLNQALVAELIREAEARSPEPIVAAPNPTGEAMTAQALFRKVVSPPPSLDLDGEPSQLGSIAGGPQQVVSRSDSFYVEPPPEFRSPSPSPEPLELAAAEPSENVIKFESFNQFCNLLCDLAEENGLTGQDAMVTQGEEMLKRGEIEIHYKLHGKSGEHGNFTSFTTFYTLLLDLAKTHGRAGPLGSESLHSQDGSREAQEHQVKAMETTGEKLLQTGEIEIYYKPRDMHLTLPTVLEEPEEPFSVGSLAQAAMPEGNQKPPVSESSKAGDCLAPPIVIPRASSAENKSSMASSPKKNDGQTPVTAQRVSFAPEPSRSEDGLAQAAAPEVTITPAAFETSDASNR